MKGEKLQESEICQGLAENEPKFVNFKMAEMWRIGLRSTMYSWCKAINLQVREVLVLRTSSMCRWRIRSRLSRIGKCKSWCARDSEMQKLCQ